MLLSALTRQKYLVFGLRTVLKNALSPRVVSVIEFESSTMFEKALSSAIWTSYDEAEGTEFQTSAVCEAARVSPVVGGIRRGVFRIVPIPPSVEWIIVPQFPTVHPRVSLKKKISS